MQSPAANTPGTEVSPRALISISPRLLSCTVPFKKSVLGQMDIPQVSEHMAEEGLECIKSMMEILHPEAVTTDQVPVEGSGTITYE